MRKISKSKKENVLQCLASGLSARETSSRTGVSKSTVSEIRKNELPNGETKKPGRKKKVTSTTIDYMVRKVTVNGIESANEVSRMVNDE